MGEKNDTEEESRETNLIGAAEWDAGEERETHTVAHLAVSIFTHTSLLRLSIHHLSTVATLEVLLEAH